jgi:hypothetical protein
MVGNLSDERALETTISELEAMLRERKPRRRLSAPLSCGGLTTRWNVETRASVVQRAIGSPRLTMKQSGMTGTSTHSPAALRTCRPPGLSSVARIVRLP